MSVLETYYFDLQQKQFLLLNLISTSIKHCIQSIHLIEILLIEISGSDQDFSLYYRRILVFHNNSLLEGVKSQSLPEIPINKILIK